MKQYGVTPIKAVTVNEALDRVVKEVRHSKCCAIKAKLAIAKGHVTSNERANTAKDVDFVCIRWELASLIAP